MADPQEILLVVPVGAPGYRPYNGAIKIKADCCGIEAWLGPRQQQKKAQTNCPTLCVFCAARAGVLPTELQNLGNPEDTIRRN